MVARSIMPHARTGSAADDDDAGRNLTRVMLDTLGKAIVTGRYENRPFPTEAEIAKAHGVSRSVTREAVKMPTAKGIVSERPRQGTIVRPLEPVRRRRPAVDAGPQVFDRPARPFQPVAAGNELEAAALAARLYNTAQMRAIDTGL